MGTMLIFNVVLLLGVASDLMLIAVSSATTSEKPVANATTKSNRDYRDPTTPAATVNWSTQSTNQNDKQYSTPYTSTSGSREESSQITSTAKSNSPQNHQPSVTYRPYQYYDSNGSNKNQRTGSSNSEAVVQATSAHPLYQGGYQPTSLPAANHQGPQYTFQIDAASFTTQPSQRIQNKVAPDGNQISQYFSNPSTYRLIAEPSKVNAQTRSSTFSTSDGHPPFPKFKGFSGSLTNRQIPSGLDDQSFEALPKFRFSPSTTFTTKVSPFAESSHGSKGAIYKSDAYPTAKNIDITPTAFSSELSSSPNFKSFDKIAQNYQYGSGPSASYSNKKVSYPGTLQLQSSPEVAGYVQAFENEPVLLNTGLEYQTHPRSGLNFEFSKANPTSLPTRSFAGDSGNYQPRVLPVHSSSSTAQIPQFKGARINAFASNEFVKPTGDYQLLANQPQLHFSAGTNLQAINDQQPISYSAKPFGQIRTDVEIINKKKPKIPKPDDSGEHDFDDGFPAGGKGFGSFGVDAGHFPRPVKVPARDTSFELPKTNLFNSYDEAFGKYSKHTSLEAVPEKIRPMIHQAAKPVYQSIEQDDDMNMDIKSSGEYRSSYSDDKIPTNSYEDGEEEESQRSEIQQPEEEAAEEEKSDDNGDDDDDESEAYKSYGVDFEKEFEESYRKELPKTDYVHVKEVPEIEEPATKSKKRNNNRNNSKSTRNNAKQRSKQAAQEEQEEPKEDESYTTHTYEQPPKRAYGDSEGRGSRASYKKSKSSDKPSVEAFGYKIPQDRGQARYATVLDSDKASTEQQVYPRKSSINREAQSYSIKSPRQHQQSSSLKLASPTMSALEIIESYTFPPFKGWNMDTASLKGPDSYGAPTFGVKAYLAPDESGYRLPQGHTDGHRYYANGRVARDLTGI